MRLDKYLKLTRLIKRRKVSEYVTKDDAPTCYQILE